MKELVAIVLAAGKGERMKSNTPKVLHKILGKCIIEYVLDILNELNINRKIIIVGDKHELLEKQLGSSYEYVLQKEQLGTAHAVIQTQPLIDNSNYNLLILYADTPLLTVNLIKKLINAHDKNNATCTLITAKYPNPYGYGRIIRENGNIIKIVEEKDATEEQKRIKEVNTGFYCFRAKPLFEALKEVRLNRIKKEYYLTDVVEILINKGYKINSIEADDYRETLGINTRIELQEATNIIKNRILNNLMVNGVTIIDNSSTFIDKEVKIKKDTIVMPNTFIEGKTEIGSNCKIGPFTRIINSKIKNNVEIQFAVIQDSIIYDNSKIGPFARIRPTSTIYQNVKIGTFVEVKNSKIKKDSLAQHLSYIGDTQIGKRVNIGAGTITCNYDGITKHKTIIEDDVFIGSDTILVAPIRIKKGAYTGAGSVITKDVPKYSLAVERSVQKNIIGWVKKRRNKLCKN